MSTEARTLQQGNRPHSLKLVGAHLCTFALYLLLALWAANIMLEDPPVPLLWPATGLGMAAIYRFGYGLVPTLLLAGAIIQVLFGAGLLQALIIAAGAAGGAALGVLVLQRLNFDARLLRVRDVLTLLLTGAGVAALVSALTGTLAMVGFSPAFAETMGLCWLADTMGVLLFTPALISLPAAIPNLRQLSRQGGLILLAPLAILPAYAVGLPSHWALPMSYVIFPLVLFLAFRLPAFSVAVSTLLAAMLAVTFTTMGEGPFAQLDMRPDLLSLYAQLALMQFTALFLVATRMERQAAEQRARDHLRTLARVGRLNAMSTMAAGIAHEINQPLCAVNSYAQAASRLLERGTNSESLRLPLQRIVEGTQKASDIVRRTRHFLETGEQQRELVSLEKLVGEAMDLLQVEYRRRGVVLQLSQVDGCPGVLVDPLEIQQVIVNLLQNALEASATRADNNPGRVKLRILANEGASRMLCLEVRDNGHGLPPGNHETLFEPLVSHRSGGTGLGLAIARSIAEAHGGRLVADDADGGGAVFFLYLPSANGHSEQTEDTSGTSGVAN